MSTQRNRTGNRLNKAPESSTDEKLPTRKFPIQRAIQKLEKELHAFNERIAELEDESHNSRAMEVLNFARRIDELRSVLVEQARKTKS
jgi:predicted RNase H-like nuclease (RuvC/YqgF family)